MIKSLNLLCDLTPKPLLILLALILLLTSCTAASIQVEVEVYKGPLSKEKNIQEAELKAYIKGAEEGLKNFQYLLSIMGANTNTNGELPTLQDFNKFKKDCLENKFNMSPICSFGPGPVSYANLYNFLRQINDLITDANHITNINMNFEHSYTLGEISKFGNRLKSTGFYWATHITFANKPREIRKALTDFANMASQYGNQIESRADALQKLAITLPSGETLRRDQLPLSVYIRDTWPTDFVHLYSWNRASDFEIWENYFLHPIDSLSSSSTDSRVRTFKHLFADQFWSSINKVHTNGQGDVRTAFIKDETGNWHLKSFDQDTSEILEAYTNMTLAAIQGVSKAVAKGATGGADFSSGMEVVSKLIGAEPGSAGNAIQISELKKFKDNTLVQLKKLRTKQQKLEEKEKGKPDEITKIRKETIDKAKEILTKYEADVKKLSVR